MTDTGTPGIETTRAFKSVRTIRVTCFTLACPEYGLAKTVPLPEVITGVQMDPGYNLTFHCRFCTSGMPMDRGPALQHPH